MRHRYKIGNVCKNGYGSVVVITDFSTHTPSYTEPYDSVSYDYYGDRSSSGTCRVNGHEEKELCGCWYDSAFRYYKSDCPDDECEKCKGSGEVLVYRKGLNDFEFLAETVMEYKLLKIKEKIENLQLEVKKLQSLI